jgi:hypothetical protein
VAAETAAAFAAASIVFAKDGKRIMTFGKPQLLYFYKSYNLIFYEIKVSL